MDQRDAPQTTVPKAGRRRIWTFVGLASGMVLCMFLVCQSFSNRTRFRPYDGEFHQAVARVDRIAIRDGGYPYNSTSEAEPVLFEVTDPDSLRTMLQRLDFTRVGLPCACEGFPRVEWYAGDERLAVTSVQHGRSLRWQGEDWTLTPKSGKWLVQWLTEHGILERDIEKGCGGPREYGDRRNPGSPPRSPAPTP